MTHAAGAMRVIAASLPTEPLPDDDPLAAAARFHAEALPRIEAMLAGRVEALAIRFPAADDKRHGWRREAVAALARRHAPVRINGLAPAQPDTSDAAMEAVLAFLTDSPGVTGQVLIAR